MPAPQMASLANWPLRTSPTTCCMSAGLRCPPEEAPHFLAKVQGLPRLW